MNDKILQSMSADEFETFMEICQIEAEKLGISVDYYINEFL